ncbi:MAG: DegT/DnrJ/EryC1/StrS family aminotransferase [Candidatus Omnitrophota bacterium]
MKIPVSKPFLGKGEIQNVLTALKVKAISGLYGEYINKFENEFANYCGCKYGVSTNSGTTALHLAIASLGIGKGDEVLVSSFTNMATFFAVLYQGAKPVPIDIEPDTWNLNPDLLESKITNKTKAIMAVHIYGHPCNMGPIMKIAAKYGLFLIEDCAEAHGATYRGRKVGSFADVAAFSFYANKIITTGEGGMLITNNKKLANKIRSLKSLAFGNKHRFMHKDIGYGYRMTNIQAAIGYAQFKKIEKLIKMKRKMADYYTKNFIAIPSLQLPIEEKYARNVYWMYHVVLKRDSALSRNKIMKELSGRGIETRESFIPYNMQEIFTRKGWTAYGDCPIANFVAKNGFYLPSSPDLTEKEQNYVIKNIKEVING